MREVVVLPRARRQLERAIDWWYRNRHKAPHAFVDDLAEMLDLIARNAGVGVPVRTRRAGVRRVLLERVGYYLYYRVTSEDLIEVISAWHASRRPPHL